MHYVNKYIVAITLILCAFSIHKIFASDYNVNDFSIIVDDAPCVDLQYDLRPGSRDYYIYGNVMKLQMYLYQNDLMEYPPTGLYAEYTYQGVMNFQNLVGLRPTGIVDYYTRMALKTASCPRPVLNNLPVNNSNINTYSQNTYQYYPSYPVTNTQPTWYCSVNGVVYSSQSAYNDYCLSQSSNTQYTVTFNSNGGSNIDTRTVVAGYVLPTSSYTPTRSGYTFVGWYTDSALTSPFSFSTPINSNMTLYAKWSQDNVAQTYTVSFQSNGGKSVDSQSVKSGSYATKPSDPTRSGYNFAGWYTESGLVNSYNFSTPVTSNITLYAKWTPYERTSFGVQISMTLCSAVIFGPIYDNLTGELLNYIPFCLDENVVSGYNATNVSKYPISGDYIYVPASSITFGAIKIGEEYYKLIDPYMYQTINGDSYKKYQVSLRITQ